jgi:hypothetical protein
MLAMVQFAVYLSAVIMPGSVLAISLTSDTASTSNSSASFGCCHSHCRLACHFFAAVLLHCLCLQIITLRQIYKKQRLHKTYHKADLPQKQIKLLPTRDVAAVQPHVLYSFQMLLSKSAMRDVYTKPLRVSSCKSLASGTLQVSSSKVDGS